MLQVFIIANDHLWKATTGLDTKTEGDFDVAGNDSGWRAGHRCLLSSGFYVPCVRCTRMTFRGGGAASLSPKCWIAIRYVVDSVVPHVKILGLGVLGAKVPGDMDGLRVRRV